MTITAFVSLTAHLNLQEYFKNMQLRNRLIFLKAMARIFPAFWSSTDLADTLWNCLIADPIGPQEQDEAFLCLEGINDLKFAEYVYQTLLPGLDVARITEKGWGCLRQYFLLINWHRRHVSVVSLMILSLIFIVYCACVNSSKYVFIATLEERLSKWIRSSHCCDGAHARNEPHLESRASHPVSKRRVASHGFYFAIDQGNETTREKTNDSTVKREGLCTL